jgi:CheY-like chemotaxis protein
MNSREEEPVQQEEFRSDETEDVIKRILIVDDNPDITLTFKKVLEDPSDDRTDESQKDAYSINAKKKIPFKVITYNDPFLALSEFKPNFYHLVLVDINMPKINGFEFSTEILKRDANPRICFMSSGQINQEALKEVYPTLSIGCFIKKPITSLELKRRIEMELE